MSRLTQEQKNYVSNHVLAKRRAAMLKPFHYQLAENLFLVERAALIQEWRLVKSIDPTGRETPLDYYGDGIIKFLKGKIESFRKALEEDHALGNKTLDELLKLQEIQYILLEEEKAVQSSLADRLSRQQTLHVRDTAVFSKSFQKQKDSADQKRYSSPEVVVAQTNEGNVSSSPAREVVSPIQHDTSSSDILSSDSSSLASQAQIQPGNNVSSSASEGGRNASVQAGGSIFESRHFKHRVVYGKNSGFVFVDTPLVDGSRHETPRIAKDMLKDFESQYRSVQKNRSIFAKIASVFSRDALAKASDPRPFWQRWFSNAPEKSPAEKISDLFAHAFENPKSNTAVALGNVLDNAVYAKMNENYAEKLEADKQKAKADAEKAKAEADAKLIREAEEASLLAWSDQEGRYLEFKSVLDRMAFQKEQAEAGRQAVVREEKQARDSIAVEFDSASNELQVEAKKLAEQLAAKAASRKDVVTPGSSTDAISAAERPEPVSPLISVHGRQQRSDSQDSGISALMSSVWSGSFLPSPDGSSRRATPVDAMESQRQNRQELLKNLEKVFAPLWASLSMEILSTRACNKAGTYTLNFKADLNAAVRSSTLVGRFTFESTIQTIVQKYENAKKLYDMLVACRQIIAKSDITDDQVLGVLRKLAEFVKLNPPGDKQLSLAMVRADWSAAMERQKNDVSALSTPSQSIR